MAVPNFHRFEGFRLDVRSRDHNPPHFHVIGPDFHALIRMDGFEVMRGWIPTKAYAEVVAWASEHATELEAEWRRLNGRG